MLLREDLVTEFLEDSNLDLSRVLINNCLVMTNSKIKDLKKQLSLLFRKEKLLWPITNWFFGAGYGAWKFNPGL